MPPARFQARGLLTAALLATSVAAVPSASAAVDPNTLTSHTTEAEALGQVRACAKVNVVVARGTDEPPNVSPGLDGWYWDPRAFAYKTGPKSPFGTFNRIAKELFQPTDGRFAAHASPNDVLRTDLTYPASKDLLGSITSGTTRLMNYLTSVQNRCGTRTKFVLLGFSQGAVVAHNVVSVPSRRLSWVSGTQALESRVINQIAAIGTVADPGFSLAYTPTGRASVHSGPMIETGYAAGTIPDVEHAANDGNFDPAYWGLTPRRLDAYPVRVAADGPPGSIVDATLSESVKRKVRNYCVARDWACQNSNPNNAFSVHDQTAWHQSSKKNLAIWSIERVRGLF